MKDLLPDDRPREKLRQHGAAALGDNELIALVIGNGSRRGNALSVANALLAAHGGLHELARCMPDELVTDRRHRPRPRRADCGGARTGTPDAGARTGRASADSRIRPTRRRICMPRFGSRGVEQFGILLLDAKHRVMRTAVLAVGTLNSSVVEPRDVFREAAIGGATAIVIFHNHPSGDPTPSPDDVALTRRLVAAGSLIGIDVVDHVILGDARYCSIKEIEGL